MSKPTTLQRIPAASLIEDFSIYPRNMVLDGHVQDLAESLKHGAEFPPLIVDAKSRRIIDGVHRRRAHLQVVGPQAQVLVLLKDYADEAAMLLDAAALNASHGRRLTSADISRIAKMAQQFKISREKLSSTLHISRAALTDAVGVRRARAEASSGPPVLQRPSALPKVEVAPRPYTETARNGESTLVLVDRLIQLLGEGQISVTRPWRNKLKLLEKLIQRTLTD